MKNYRLLFLLLIICFQAIVSYGQIVKSFYKEHRESNSKLVAQGVSFTIEKLKNKKFIYKKYYPELRVVTHYITMKSRKSRIKDGLYIERWDDGKVILEGEYVDDVKQGRWKEYDWEGVYKDNKRVGEWIVHDKRGKLTEIKNFAEGQLHGKQIKYDSLGQVIGESLYEEGLLISTTIDTSYAGTEIMPRFPGCEDLNATNEEKKKCADQKMLNHMYQRLKYPRKSIKQEIEGTAIIRFVIEEDGSISDIKVLRGLCDAIKQECQKLVQNMPRWTPGYQYGEPVRVQFTLPIKFNLE